MKINSKFLGKGLNDFARIKQLKTKELVGFFTLSEIRGEVILNAKGEITNVEEILSKKKNWNKFHRWVQTGLENKTLSGRKLRASNGYEKQRDAYMKEKRLEFTYLSPEVQDVYKKTKKYSLYNFVNIFQAFLFSKKGLFLDSFPISFSTDYLHFKHRDYIEYLIQNNYLDKWYEFLENKYS